MGFFICNICGERVERLAVKKHCKQICRNKAKNVSCIICLKTFNGKTFIGHNKCTSCDKESWMNIIRSVLDNTECQLSPELRDAFQRLQSVDNVPRKKSIFRISVFNSLKIPRDLATEMWFILKKELEKWAVRSGTNTQNPESLVDIIRDMLDKPYLQLRPQLRDDFQRLQSMENVPRTMKKFEYFVEDMGIPRAQAREMWGRLKAQLRRTAINKKKKSNEKAPRTETEETVPGVAVPPMRRINVENGEATQAEETVAIVLAFRCNLCGERVKSLAVKEHYDLICRNETKKTRNVSCIRCQRTFYGEAYVRHDKCTSVDGKRWMDTIFAILDNTEYQLSPRLRDAFQALLQTEINVPQKRKSFINFMYQNKLNKFKSQATEMWNILHKELEKIDESSEKAQFTVRKQIAEAETVPEARVSSLKRINVENRETTLTETEDKVPEAVPPLKRIKLEQAEESVPEADVLPSKRIKLENGEATRIEEIVPRADVPPMKRIKMENEESTQTAATTEETDDFDWAAELMKLVVKQPDGIVLKKLKKKLAKKYTKHLSVTVLSEKQSKKFDKRFNKHLKKLRMEGDLVK
ncbi:hypothetical protein ACLKA7_014588 [Drosophila subpalustris]